MMLFELMIYTMKELAMKLKNWINLNSENFEEWGKDAVGALKTGKNTNSIRVIAAGYSIYIHDLSHHVPARLALRH